MKYFALAVAGISSMVVAIISIWRPSRETKSVMNERAIEDIFRKALMAAPQRTLSLKQLKQLAKIQSKKSPQGATDFARTRLRNIKAQHILDSSPEQWKL